MISKRDETGESSVLGPETAVAGGALHPADGGEPTFCRCAACVALWERVRLMDDSRTASGGDPEMGVDVASGDSRTEVVTVEQGRLRVDRSHEECDECALQEIEPPRCRGHVPGPSACRMFVSAGAVAAHKVVKQPADDGDAGEHDAVKVGHGRPMYTIDTVIARIKHVLPGMPVTVVTEPGTFGLQELVGGEPGPAVMLCDTERWARDRVRTKRRPPRAVIGDDGRVERRAV
jgi:hypothetical protein